MAGSGSGSGNSSGGADNFLKAGAEDILAIGWPFSNESTTATHGSKLLMWTESEPTTSFSPLLLQRTARLKVMRSQASRLIDKIRCSAQPNEQFRHDRLVASAVNAASDRMKLVKAIQDCGQACFDHLEPLATYANQLAALEEAIDKAHELFLRQVMLYSVKPMQKFVEEDCPRILRQYESLEKARDAYDKRRKKKKKKVVMAPPQSTAVLNMDPKLAEFRKRVIQAADALTLMINELTQVQLMLAGYVDIYLRAESGYYKQLQECTV